MNKHDINDWKEYAVTKLFFSLLKNYEKELRECITNLNTTGEEFYKEYHYVRGQIEVINILSDVEFMKREESDDDKEI